MHQFRLGMTALWFAVALDQLHLIDCVITTCRARAKR
jgi:hypothetical protein